MPEQPARIVSVNTGIVAPLFIEQHGRHRRVVSAIHKQAREGPVAIGRLGLDGDEQADLSVHGGLGKAVYAYPIEHYPFWEQQCRTVFKREQALSPGTFGENLTIAGLLEAQLWVADRLQIGTVLLEVTEPRAPCYKLAAKMGFSHAVKLMLQSGYTGFYLRVVNTGAVGAGDPITLIPGPRKEALATINERRLKGRQKDLF